MTKPKLPRLSTKMNSVNPNQHIIIVLALSGILSQSAQVYANQIDALNKAALASQENFEIEAVWSGSPQWMSGVNGGFETFGGSIGKGVDVYTSSIITEDYVPVEIRFASDSTKWTLAQTIRFGTNNTAGVGTFPGSAWDISNRTDPRRLNLCYMELGGEYGFPDPNFMWDPDTSALGKYEKLFVMSSSYDTTGTTYAGIDILNDAPDVLYVWWPRVADGHTFFESEPASLLIHPRINLSFSRSINSIEFSWFTPGQPPDKFRIFWGDTAPDSLLVELPAIESTYLQTGLTAGMNYHYIIKSYDTLDNKVLSSFEKVITVRGLAPISSVFPSPQEISAVPSTEIVVNFDSVMNSASINDSTFRVFGRWSGPATGSFQMENGNMQVRFSPDEPLSAGELVTVSLSKGIQTSNMTPMLSGYAWNFWIKTQPASLEFTEIGQISVRKDGEGPILTYGAYAGDLNDDGYSDLTTINETSDDVRIFLNDGSGGYDSFSIVPFSGDGASSPNAGADFDGDGKIDLAVGTASSDKLRILLGDGSGNFHTSVEYTAGHNVRGIAIIDLDGDGHDDIATSNYGGNNVTLLRNLGDGTFAPAVSLESGFKRPTGCVSADANNDGILDLFVGTARSNEIILFLGDGDGNLIFSAKVDAKGDAWMITAGDVNGDGNIDVVAVNSGSENAVVVFGNGIGGLEPAVTYPALRFPTAIDLGDLDGDGDLDMVTTSLGDNVFRVFENDGSGNFINPQDYPANLAASCTILHDRNNDGILDMTGIDEGADVIILFDRSCCIGIRGDINGDGINANVLDLTYMIDDIFRGGPASLCEKEADLDGNGIPSNVLDLTYLIDDIFRGGPDPVSCD